MSVSASLRRLIEALRTRRGLIEALLFVLALGGGYALRARVATDWTFTGSDGYIYMGAATELAERHRYGIRLPPWVPAQPREAPLTYGRPPGYVFFLAAVARPPLKSYEEFFARVKPVQRLIDLCTCVLVFAMGFRIGGRKLAWPAFLAALCHPFLLLFAASILTETLATFLTTAILLLVLLALDPGAGARRAAPCLLGAGALAALGTLLRADGILITPCLVLPLFLRREPLPERLRALLWAALAFVLLFSPWPLRNLARFGAPHPFGTTCDTRGQAIEHTWFMRWFATWIVKEEQMPPTQWCLLRPECVATVATYPAEAFDSEAEKQEVARLFALRQREGLSKRVDEGFRALALQRVRSHPLRVLVAVPLQRALHLWVNHNDLPLRGTSKAPWPAVMPTLQRGFLGISLCVDVLGLIGLLILGTSRRWRAQRRAALLFATALGCRTGLFSFISFLDGRYVLELLPVMLVLSAVTASELFRMARSRGSGRTVPASGSDRSSPWSTP